MKYIGAHVSISGGVENAPVNARELGATAFALFTKNQRQWHAAPLTAESIAAFKTNCEKFGFDREMILPHDSYLINLGQPDPEKRKSSIAAFTDEMERCRQLGLVKLNFHPGSHLKLVSEEEDIRLIAESVREAIDSVPDVVAVFENTAGQGSNMGYRFEQIAAMLEQVDRPGRVGVCLDTCHTFAAGYDLVTPEGYEATFKRFDELIGFNCLAGMHLNDSKSKLGGKLDRHNSIGKGELGWETFRRLMTDPRFDGIPLVLETIDETLWKQEIAILQAFSRNENPELPW